MVRNREAGATSTTKSKASDRSVRPTRADLATISLLDPKPKLGIIAGNGRFPFLVLDAARAQGHEVVVAAIKEETSPEIESRGATVHWLSLGELSKLIETFRSERRDSRRHGRTGEAQTDFFQHSSLMTGSQPHSSRWARMSFERVRLQAAP